MWDDMMRRILQPVGGISPHVTSPYGAMTGRPFGSSNPHRGIDFNYVGGQSARLNTNHPELRSPVNGVVERAGDDQWGTISIRDNNGVRHQILHTNSRKVKVGDVVAAGQVIGTMGNPVFLTRRAIQGTTTSIIRSRIAQAMFLTQVRLRMHWDRSIQFPRRPTFRSMSDI